MTFQFLYPLRYDAQTRRFQFDSQTDTDSRSCCVKKHLPLRGGIHSDNVHHSCAYESLNGVMAFIMTTGVQPCTLLSQHKIQICTQMKR